MRIDFNENLMTGIDEIDSQHKQLFETINNLSEIKSTQDNIWDSLLELEKYVCIHFETEESYMVKYQYPELQEHIDEHAKFIQKFAELKVEFNQLGFSAEFVLELQSFLVEWLLTHYKNIDTKMAKYIKNKIN